MNSVMAIPDSGDVQAVGMLADPRPDDPFLAEESVALFNQTEGPLDAGAWSWSGARLKRRRIIPAHQSVEFTASEFEEWPGLSNAGGGIEVVHPSGVRMTQWSWSPCDHSDEKSAESGIPLTRSPQPGMGWHTQGLDPLGQEPVIVGFGCVRDWSGEVAHLDVYLSMPASFLGDVEWNWSSPGSPSKVLVPENVPDHFRALRFPPPDGESWSLDWPNTGHLVGKERGGMQWSVDPTCPLSAGNQNHQLKISEALWNARGGGGEFVEVHNVGDVPVDLSGLQAGDRDGEQLDRWRTWVPSGTSLVLKPGAVMAFGRCPRWFRSGHLLAGRACWPVPDWSALPDHDGGVSIRLPSQGPEVLDEVAWNDQMEGPWWWTDEGWSWTRMGWGPTDWSPSRDGGSPGRPDEVGIPSLPAGGASVPRWNCGGWNAHPALVISRIGPRGVGSMGIGPRRSPGDLGQG